MRYYLLFNKVGESEAEVQPVVTTQKQELLIGHFLSERDKNMKCIRFHHKMA